MSGNVAGAVAIAVVGMGLVFGAILLFWAFMALLVRGTSKGQPEGDRPVTTPENTEAEAETELRRQAALAAVAVALALGETEARPQPFPVPPTALVSTWQAVRRAHQFGQHRGVR